MIPERDEKRKDNQSIIPKSTPKPLHCSSTINRESLIIKSCLISSVNTTHLFSEIHVSPLLGTFNLLHLTLPKQGPQITSCDSSSWYETWNVLDRLDAELCEHVFSQPFEIFDIGEDFVELFLDSVGLLVLVISHRWV